MTELLNCGLPKTCKKSIKYSVIKRYTFQEIYLNKVRGIHICTIGELINIYSLLPASSYISFNT